MSQTRVPSLEEKFCLNNSDFTKLLTHRVSQEKDATLKILEVNESEYRYYLVQKHDKKFFIGTMTKDAKDNQIESYLLNIVDVIKQFCAEYEACNNEEEIIVLLPLFMCQNFNLFYLARKHAVLVELNLKNKDIQVHDSQGVIPWFFYSDIFNQIASPLSAQGFHYSPWQQYHTYAAQDNRYYLPKDFVSCGYYVLAYISHILATGNSNGCKSIKLNILTDYENKEDYIHRQIHHQDKEVGLEDWENVPSDRLLTFHFTENGLEVDDEEKKSAAEDISQATNSHALDVAQNVKPKRWNLFGLFDGYGRDNAKDESVNKNELQSPGSK